MRRPRIGDTPPAPPSAFVYRANTAILWASSQSTEVTLAKLDGLYPDQEPDGTRRTESPAFDRGLYDERAP